MLIPPDPADPSTPSLGGAAVTSRRMIDVIPGKQPPCQDGTSAREARSSPLARSAGPLPWRFLGTQLN